MPLYKFQCAVCEYPSLIEMTFEEHDLATTHVDGCVMLGVLHECDLGEEVAMGRMVQVFDFHFTRPMPDHYNHSLGQRVSNTGQVTSALSRQSDEMSERMGHDHHYELVDPTEPSAVGVTDAGLESTERAQHDARADGHKSTFS